jgi:hypothetical protein
VLLVQRARPGAALEDVSAWVQSLGHWELQARRVHDTLVRTSLVARGLEPVLPRDFRRLYWVAGACNALAGALPYHPHALRAGPHAAAVGHDTDPRPAVAARDSPCGCALACGVIRQSRRDFSHRGRR